MAGRLVGRDWHTIPVPQRLRWQASIRFAAVARSQTGLIVRQQADFPVVYVIPFRNLNAIEQLA